jgi:hypothetical protein
MFVTDLLLATSYTTYLLVGVVVVRVRISVCWLAPYNNNNNNNNNKNNNSLIPTSLQFFLISESRLFLRGAATTTRPMCVV